MCSVSNLSDLSLGTLCPPPYGTARRRDVRRIPQPAPRARAAFARRTSLVTAEAPGGAREDLYPALALMRHGLNLYLHEAFT